MRLTGGSWCKKNLLRFPTLYFSKSITASGTRATWHMNFQRFHKVCSKCNCPYVTFKINGYLMISDYTAWSTSPVFQIPACATAEIDTAKPSLEGRAVGASQIFRLLRGVRRFPPIHWQPNRTWIQLWFGKKTSKWQTSAFLTTHSPSSNNILISSLKRWENLWIFGKSIQSGCKSIASDSKEKLKSPWKNDMWFKHSDMSNLFGSQRKKGKYTKS